MAVLDCEEDKGSIDFRASGHASLSGHSLEAMLGLVILILSNDVPIPCTNQSPKPEIFCQIVSLHILR